MPRLAETQNIEWIVSLHGDDVIDLVIGRLYVHAAKDETLSAWAPDPLDITNGSGIELVAESE